jgi:hypothetical protein
MPPAPAPGYCICNLEGFTACLGSLLQQLASTSNQETNTFGDMLANGELLAVFL